MENVENNLFDILKKEQEKRKEKMKADAKNKDVKVIHKTNEVIEKVNKTIIIEEDGRTLLNG